jgi:alpha-ribazole phosphatase/probable phosphoglycerate mutase
VIELVYETHAISTHNERGIATGWLPGELSEQGRELARELGRRRRDDGITVVFSSDLRRAVETAEIAFAGSGIPVQQDERLRECNYGDLNGGSAAGVAAVKLSRIETPFPNGESYLDVVVRTREFLADLVSDHDGERVLLIAHSANRWAIEHLLEGRPLADLIQEQYEWQPGWEYVLDERAATIL